MKPRIGFITQDNEKNLSAFEVILKLIKILEPLATEVTWIAINCPGDESRLPKNVSLLNLKAKDKTEESFLKQIFYELLTQLKVILKLRKLREVDVFIFSGGNVLLLPFLYIALFLRKKTILRVESRASMQLRRKLTNPRHRIIKIIVFSLIEKIMYSLADRIAIQYELILERDRLEKYQAKIYPGGQYVDKVLFRKTRELTERTYEIGYIGRLSEEKGALQFAQSLPLILKDKERKVLIVGEGESGEKVRKIVADSNIANMVELPGWVENKKIPSCLNKIEILVIPSFTEGLPNIVLEAMACGTLVLATPVGSIPELIKDEETGFVLPDNSPECIAKNVIRALNHPNLEELTKNARVLIEDKFTYEKAVERYRNILDSLDLR